MNLLTVTTADPSTPSRETDDHDARLQASRRVDWRFLLPDPDLGDTAYVGRRDASLIESLRQFSSSLTIFEYGRVASSELSQFPVVVARNASRSELCQASGLIRAGGIVYVEVDRRSSSSPGRCHPRNDRPPRGVHGCVAVLRQLGLSEAHAHWHWPDFDTCNEIVPLNDPAAGICSLNRRGGNGRARWKRRVARMLLETRLLERFVPCFSIIARRRS